jgi:[acyl-carrier-protein] S-malonyltransferase
MTAIIGLDIHQVESILSESSHQGIVSVANHNTAHQIVISGEPIPVQSASGLMEARGGRAIPLKVSGGWHTKLIRGATDEFQAFLDSTTTRKPDIPVIFNVTGDASYDIDRIRELLVEQLCNPVRWYDTMVRMIQEEVSVFVEVGPGTVLRGLLRKTLPKKHECALYCVNNMKTLEKFIEDMI